MNVIVILLDSLRRDYVSCYNDVRRPDSLGQPVLTPNLQRLAAESATFTNAHVASFACVPARRDMWTGCYDFFHRGWGPLLDSDYTHAQALGDAGYVSMLATDNYPLVDSGYVIQQSYTKQPVSTQPGNYHRNFTGWQLIRGNQTDRAWPADVPVKLPCAPEKIRSGAHRMELYLQQNAGRRWERQWFGPQVIQTGIDWIEENRRRPFFLWLDCFNTHEPFDPPRHYEEVYSPNYTGERLIFPAYARANQFRPKEIAHLRAMYAGQVTMMDAWIGRLMESLRVTGVLDNTLVIFTSDHGFLFGDHGLVGKNWRDRDSYLWDGIADIPLLVRHPQGIGAGKKINSLVQLIDVYPTILEAAGVKPRNRIDGHSLLPLIRGEQKSVREFGFYGAHGGPIHVTDGRYTLFASDPKSIQGPPRLFDTKRDPNQQRNIIRRQPRVARRLFNALAAEIERQQPPPSIRERVAAAGAKIMEH